MKGEGGELASALFGQSGTERITVSPAYRYPKNRARMRGVKEKQLGMDTARRTGSEMQGDEGHRQKTNSG